MDGASLYTSLLGSAVLGSQPRNLLFLEGERLRAPCQRRGPAPAAGAPALFPRSWLRERSGLSAARQWGFLPGEGIQLSHRGAPREHPQQPALVPEPLAQCQLHQGGDVQRRGGQPPAGPGRAHAGQGRQRHRGGFPLGALGLLRRPRPGAPFPRWHPLAQWQVEVRHLRHGLHRPQRAHGAQAQPHGGKALPLQPVRSLLHPEGKPPAPHQAALRREALQVSLLQLRLSEAGCAQRAPPDTLRLLPYGGQALQVQLLRPQLQAAEHAGGAQGAVPQLPAEPAPGAAGPGQPGSGRSGRSSRKKGGAAAPRPRHPRGEEMRELEMVPEALLHPSSERPSFIDRLASSLTKRKRSTPQKFVGEKQMRFSLSDLPFDVNSGFEKDVEMVSAHHPLDPAYGAPLSLLGGEHLRGLRLPPTNCISEVTPVISSVYTQLQALPARLELPGGREAAEGHEDVGDAVPVLYRGREHAGSPPNGCADSSDTESNHEERSSQGPAGSSRQSPAYAKEDPKVPEGPPAARSTPSSAKEALRVLNEDGEQLRAFKCEHCRILFLDHVMFTIHMGCHGFRDPFECNICGYHSQDRRWMKNKP
ncbi:zinc finger protein Eos isoform X2 [Pezoporus flaviventris]|uniref:zinc finger protein Eos isoform X2 n=1 Tax=Pezoporus flaviventris TaxID=889875 RepID=UPI002AB13060|nr:zinc finger protein Eos isoform X2 [Pezoporus flaviventris]